MAPMETSGELSLREVWEGLKAQRNLFLWIPLLLGVAALVYGFFLAEPTRQAEISYAVFCLKKKKKTRHSRYR